MLANSANVTELGFGTEFGWQYRTAAVRKSAKRVLGKQRKASERASIFFEQELHKEYVLRVLGRGEGFREDLHQFWNKNWKKKYVLGRGEAAERISTNFEKELNYKYLLGRGKASERIPINLE